MVTRYAPIRAIGLHEQAAWMERLHPGFTREIIKEPTGTILVCRGQLQPTPINDIYTVRIEYRVGGKPKAWVESPELQRRKPDERQPHTYMHGDLCLYYADFTSECVLATTIVPWIMHWLFFYESWLVTGEWQGGGIHPGQDLEANDVRPAETFPRQRHT
ncbi:MAG TPA: hypothetical protein VGN72_14870 [Tepidisphaeraceae bacterium]|jgi:hypothetical protein|nr:hypothetical protein [Tepidisphaeraceae bacterium]